MMMILFFLLLTGSAEATLTNCNKHSRIQPIELSATPAKPRYNKEFTMNAVLDKEIPNTAIMSTSVKRNGVLLFEEFFPSPYKGQRNINHTGVWPTRLRGMYRSRIRFIDGFTNEELLCLEHILYSTRMF